MKKIFINRDRQSLGEFDESEVVAGLASGRFLPTDLAWHEKMDAWAPLESLSGLGATSLPPIPGASFVKPGTFSIGVCLQVGWECFKKNAGICIGALVLFYAASAILQIPIQFGPEILAKAGKNMSEDGRGFFVAAMAIFVVFYVGYLVIATLLGAGYFYFHVELLRGRSNLATLLHGFRSPVWGQLLLVGGVSISVVLVGCAAVLVPAYFLGLTIKSELPFVLAAILFGILATYLFMGWMFAYLLIIDRRMPFWKAMELSRRTVTKHFFPLLGLMAVMALLMILGALACCVGLIVTIPVSYLAFAHAYLQLFPEAEPPALEELPFAEDGSLTQ